MKIPHVDIILKIDKDISINNCSTGTCETCKATCKMNFKERILVLLFGKLQINIKIIK